MKKGSAATHDISEPIIKIDKTFLIHPVEFAKCVVKAIEDDFETFAISPDVESHLPKIGIYEPPQNGLSTMVSTEIWATR